MMSSLAPEEGAPASPCAAGSKNVDAGNATVSSPVRHMHRDVAKLLQSAGTTPRRQRRKMPAATEARGRARYGCAFEEETPAEEFAPPRLVWAKVRSHPWWPGQVFDPANASRLALREGRKRRRDAVLVACFGDETFLWADAEDLLPLRDGFPRLAETGGRSTSKHVFASAVEDALDEVARRVDAGLSCGCCPASIKEMPVLPNSGVRRAARGAAVEAAFARDAFRGEAFVRYVRALAVAPTAGADMLDLVIASAQLKAFTEWRSPRPDWAMVVAECASRGRATTPRRERTRRADRGGDAPPGDATLSMCARAAAADAAFMRDVFRRGEAPEEYAMALTPPPSGTEPRDLGVSTTAQRNAFSQWRGAPGSIMTECAAAMDVVASGTMVVAAPAPVCRDTAKKTRSPGGDDADADHGNCRIVMTSCISSRDDSACENDGDDDDWETESEDSDVGSNWGLGWKDYVIFLQFVAIFLLVCRLMQ